MALEQWAVPQLKELLPLEDGELKQVISYTKNLPDREAEEHLSNLLGDSPNAIEFISSFIKRRGTTDTESDSQQNRPSTKTLHDSPPLPPAYAPPARNSNWAPAPSETPGYVHRHTNAAIEAG